MRSNGGEPIRRLLFVTRLLYVLIGVVIGYWFGRHEIMGANFHDYLWLTVFLGLGVLLISIGINPKLERDNSWNE